MEGRLEGHQLGLSEQAEEVRLLRSWLLGTEYWGGGPAAETGKLGVEAPPCCVQPCRGRDCSQAGDTPVITSHILESLQVQWVTAQGCAGQRQRSTCT